MKENNYFNSEIKNGLIKLSDVKEDSIRVLISGDFCPVNRVEKQCIDGHYKEIFGDVLPVLKNSDLAVTNLECPLTLKSNPIMKSGPHLTAHPSGIEALKFGGFEAVTLANNHIMDQGSDGLGDTLRVCNENGIKTVGAGKNPDDAGKALYIEKNGIKIAIINVTEYEFSIAGENKPGANLLDPVKNYYQIKEAKQKSDHVLVIVHGGVEHYSFPSRRMKSVFEFFVDTGASAVIGHHSHCPGGILIYKNAPLIFGLGNFIFDWPGETFKPWFEGYLSVLNLSLSGVNEIELTPYVQYLKEPEIKVLQGLRKQEFLEQISDFSRIISDERLLMHEREKLVRERTSGYFASLLNFNRITRFLMKKGFIKKNKIKDRHLLRLLNILRCDAHHDLAIDVLEDILIERELK